MKAIITILSLILTQMAFADIGWQIYSDRILKTAQNDGKEIILGFHKKGCGTCHSQDKALEAAGITDSKNVVFLKVERKNDAHEKVYKKYGLSSRQWAAIVLLKNKKEIARINPGITSGKEITNLITQLRK